MAGESERSERMSEIKIGDKVRLTKERRAQGIRLTKNDTASAPAWGIVTGFANDSGLCYVRALGAKMKTLYAIGSLEKVEET